MRAFVGIFPPTEVRRALLRSARTAPIAGDVRWTRDENVHVTLKFLGDVEKAALNDIHVVLREVARRHEPVRVQPYRLGAFPSYPKARVVWAGVGEGSAELSSLAADVEAFLEPLGFGRERKAYVPHLTLGRSRGRPARLPEEYDLCAPAFTAGKLELVESKLGAGGATYNTVESYPLNEDL